MSICSFTRHPGRVGRHVEDLVMGRGILLWLLGVPIPIIMLALFTR